MQCRLKLKLCTIKKRHTAKNDVIQTSLMITYWTVEGSDVQNHNDCHFRPHIHQGIKSISNNISKQFFTFRSTVKNTATKYCKMSRCLAQ